MKKIWILVFLFFVVFLVPMVLAIDISDCSVLDQPGATYYLTQNITDSSTSYCMNISANNVT
ncbi:MAG: hypothetical protein J7K87_00750, partial [Candidatus Aenigmarchaeota archaeon]|nr:hypothetical protein [Candidatus Aenigmarchaeota archaeon]